MEEPGDAPECPLCGTTPMNLRKGQWGPFWACPNYPKCKGIVKADPKGIPVPPDEPRGDLSQLWQGLREAAGPLRRVRLLHRLPHLQDGEEGDPGRALPQVRRRPQPPQDALRQGLLRLHQLPQVRLHRLGQARPRHLPACKNPIMGEKTKKPRGKDPIQVSSAPSAGMKSRWAEPLAGRGVGCGAAHETGTRLGSVPSGRESHPNDGYTPLFRLADSGMKPEIIEMLYPSGITRPALKGIGSPNA